MREEWVRAMTRNARERQAQGVDVEYVAIKIGCVEVAVSVDGCQARPTRCDCLEWGKGTDYSALGRISQAGTVKPNQPWSQGPPRETRDGQNPGQEAGRGLQVLGMNCELRTALPISQNGLPPAILTAPASKRQIAASIRPLAAAVGTCRRHKFGIHLGASYSPRKDIRYTRF